MQRTLPLVAVGILLVGSIGAVTITRATNRGLGSSEAPTNGEFVLRFAQSMGLAGQSASPSQALDTLQAARLLGTEPINLDGRLTEGLVTSLSQGARLGVATNNPDRAFSRTETNAYFSVFGTTLAAGSTAGTGATPGMVTGGTADPDDNDKDHERNPNAADPRERGKGKKVGLSNHFPF